MLYFAYGSNMSLPRLSERVSGISKLGVATLDAHTLMFQKASIDGSAKCDIVVSEDESSTIFGVVFKFPDTELAKLHKAEGLGEGYNCKTVSVVLPDDRNIVALTYFATKIDMNLKPYHWYKQHVVYGAKESELPEWYIEKIEAIESIDDPCPIRTEKQIQMYR